MLEIVSSSGGHTFQMWATFGFILLALGLYMVEGISIEVTSIGIICLLMLFFHFFPVRSPTHVNELQPKVILSGFANSALITVLALLVVGQGMVRAGVLERVGRLVVDLGRGGGLSTLAVVLTTVIVASAFLNNIPVVVIFIPIMHMLAAHLGRHDSKIMMGLGYAAVLGGMTTLIGSGTNLLVSESLVLVGERAFHIFDFTIPGLIMAGIGLLYLLFVCPALLPDRSSLADRIATRSERHFLAEIKVAEGGKLENAVATGSLVKDLADVRVRMIRRGNQAMTSPFHDLIIEAGDIVVIAASKKSLAGLLSRNPDLLIPDAFDHAAVDEAIGADDAKPQQKIGVKQIGERILVEVMVAPASRLISQRLDQMAFQYETNCHVLAIRHRAHMFRSRMTDIPLDTGDVLLLQGEHLDIKALEGNSDILVLEGSRHELPAAKGARRAMAIFAGFIAMVATGVVPTVVAGVTAAIAMVATGVMNIRVATRALDTKVFTMIPAGLALGAALEKTGGAGYLADNLVLALDGFGNLAILSAFFLFVAVLTNVISSKACAVLFTPIGVDLAHTMGVDPHVFAVALLMSANCAFATPIGYQVNLLVMGPGHYRFSDFTRAGAPLVVLLWVAFTAIAHFYYGV